MRLRPRGTPVASLPEPQGGERAAAQEAAADLLGELRQGGDVVPLGRLCGSSAQDLGGRRRAGMIG